MLGDFIGQFVTNVRSVLPMKFDSHHIADKLLK